MSSESKPRAISVTVQCLYTYCSIGVFEKEGLKVISLLHCIAWHNQVQ